MVDASHRIGLETPTITTAHSRGRPETRKLPAQQGSSAPERGAVVASRRRFPKGKYAGTGRYSLRRGIRQVAFVEANPIYNHQDGWWQSGDFCTSHNSPYSRVYSGNPVHAQGIDMNNTYAEQFNELYNRFEAGDQGGALQQLRQLTNQVEDPWDKAEFIYHETMFLLEMGEIPQAGERLRDLGAAVKSLCGPVLPRDGYELDVRVSLPVMARYAELKVAIAEGKEAEALRILEELILRYPKQLSTPGFRSIFDEIESQHGFLLADLGRWEEAKPFLEKASPPEAWRAVLSYYLGHCYYVEGDYEHAKEKLSEAFERGLSGHWGAKAHYVLGIIYYRLSDMASAKREFELCAQTADKKYLQSTKIWEWLEATSRVLGLRAEADDYRQRRLGSGSRVN
jgi:tetratricopeptide (TPR) repeat protein